MNQTADQSPIFLHLQPHNFFMYCRHGAKNTSLCICGWNLFSTLFAYMARLTQRVLVCVYMCWGFFLQFVLSMTGSPVFFLSIRSKFYQSETKNFQFTEPLLPVDWGYCNRLQSIQVCSTLAEPCFRDLNKAHR